MPNFEVLDARIASALKKSSIIPGSKGESVWRNKRPRSRNRFLRGRQIAYLIYEYFRVTAANDSVEYYADLFTIVLRTDDIQELETMDASEIYSKRLKCKGSNISQTKWKIHFSIRRWSNKIYWRRSGTENVDLDTGTPNSKRKSP